MRIPDGTEAVGGGTRGVGAEVPIRLRRITLHLIRMHLKTPFTTSFGTECYHNAILVEVEEKGGEVGWGECPLEAIPSYWEETFVTGWYVLTRFLVPRILREELQGPQEVWQRLVAIRGHNIAKAGLEMAIWDLAARLSGRPLYQLLGGVRNRIVSGVSIGIQLSVEATLHVVQRRVEEGYRRIKLKVKPGWDLEVVAAVRREFPEIPLSVDANGAYRLEQHLHTLRRFDDYNLLMIEQPLAYNDLVEHAALQRVLRTPICLDESIRDLRTAHSALVLASCQIVNIKAPRVGGHLQARRIHDLCQFFRIPVWIGGMLETGVGRAHNIALATLPNVKLPNDTSATDRYYEEDITEPKFVLNKDGTIDVPQRPGIGVEVVEERLRRYRLRAQEATP